MDTLRALGVVWPRCQRSGSHASAKEGRMIAFSSIRIRTLLSLAACTSAIVGLSAQGPDASAQAYAMIKEAQRNYQTVVKDYTCLFVARENLKGRMNEDQFMQLKFRQQPFSVSMKWLGPARMAGQEVAFVHGKHNNKLRVQSKGILGVAGFVDVAVDDPRVREQSRHTIYETGISNLIESTLKSWELDKQTGKAVTRIGEAEFDKRACYRIETIRAERLPQLYSYRSVIYLEKNSKYPIRNENYFWPAAGGNPDGELMETFSYTNLQFNVGLTDREFDK
jgi:hypothetical protein